MSTILPERAHLSHLKAQAKDLLAAYQTGNADAVTRVRAYFATSVPVRLSGAQLVIAREYGFASWAKLKAHIVLCTSERSQEADADRLAALTTNGDADAVLARLSEAPELATATFSAACATGSRDAMAGFVAADPRLVRAATGDKGWEPLLYVCYSCLLKDAAYRPRLVETARYLLDNGADPNAHWLNANWNDAPEPCLYGATGVNDCPELAALLLSAGANPNDNESLYHSTELATPECLKLLLDNGASVSHGNGLMRLLDREEPEWVRLFLGYAKSPDEIPPVLSHALRRGRSAEVFRALLASGMAVDTTDHNGLTPYQSAARLGRGDVCELLIAAGADAALSPVDTLLARIAGGDVPLSDISPETIALLDAEPAPELIRQAEAGNALVLKTLLAAGANPNVRDLHCVPIHQACLNGHLDAVRVLLKYGADPRIEDTVHKGHAVGWTCAGSQGNPTAPQETYVAIVELLLDSGGVLPETAWGSPEVREVLVRRGAKPA
ncbi:MAG: hypothetical protein H7Y38_02825 [Armatimonadetes bacterium]|nr:hypothetical protein [Armatimonadota bacterium]